METGGRRAAGWLIICIFGWLSIARASQAEAAPDRAAGKAALEAMITAKLGLTQPQQAALGDVESVVERTLRDRPPLSADEYKAMTFLQRARFQADQLALAASKAKARLEAAERFYALLSADQRAGLDAIMAPVKTETAAAQTPAPFAAEIAANQALPGHTDADWLVKSTGDEIGRVYPTKARLARVRGTAVLNCTADEEGLLADYVVKTETPPDQGFGNAALEMTAYMRMRPATNFGAPVRSEVTIPLQFTPEEDLAHRIHGTPCGRPRRPSGGCPRVEDIDAAALEVGDIARGEGGAARCWSPHTPLRR